MLIEQFLNEVVWAEGHSAAVDAKRFPSDWIHFSNINKLGINPQAQHRDPPGIYFYPIKWLLGEESSLNQFATHFPFYFIVKIKKSSNFINLGRMTQEQAQSIADANGWGDDLKKFRSNPALLSGDGSPMQKKLLKKPGGLFYATMDYLRNVEKKFRWLQMLKDVAGLFDPGYGIIAGGEPAQAIVIDQTLMKVISSGQNKDTGRNLYANYFKKAVEQCGGSFSFKKQLPTGVIERDGKVITVNLNYGNCLLTATINQNGHWINKTEKQDSIMMNNSSEPYIIKDFVYFIEKNLKLADPGAPKNVYWSSERVREVARMLSPGVRMNEKSVNGCFTLYYMESSLGSMTYGARYISNRDTLRVEAKVYSRERFEIEVENTFPSGTPPETVVQKMGDEIYSKLKPHMAPTATKEKLGKILHFNLGT